MNTESSPADLHTWFRSCLGLVFVYQYMYIEFPYLKTGYGTSKQKHVSRTNRCGCT